MPYLCPCLCPCPCLSPCLRLLRRLRLPPDPCLCLRPCPSIHTYMYIYIYAHVYIYIYTYIILVYVCVDMSVYVGVHTQTRSASSSFPESSIHGTSALTSLSSRSWKVGLFLEGTYKSSIRDFQNIPSVIVWMGFFCSMALGVGFRALALVVLTLTRSSGLLACLCSQN